MQLKPTIRTILLGTSLIFLTSCAAWRSGQQQDASTVDANANYASNTQTAAVDNDDAVAGNDADKDLTKRTYYFAYDKSDINEEDKPAIEANAQYLKSHPGAKALIEGHTDPRGSREYNIALGERRSKAIQEMLKEEGVNPSQIRIISYGAEKLASNGHSETDYQLDRRGVLVYLQQ